LWRELKPVSLPADRAVRISWWAPAELQVTQRESDIHDGMLSLYPYFDSDVRTRAYCSAVAAGSSPAEAHAEADAAMVTRAVRARAADPEGRVISSAETAAAAPATRSPFGHNDGPRDLVRMSVALRRSPVVAAARGRTTTGPEKNAREPAG
jgi:hypothetical protein